MLTFNLKKEWFEKIKSGKKTHEYRVANSYWYRRLHKVSYKLYYDEEGKFYDDSVLNCCFACGYPKKDDKEKRLYAKITGISTYNGLETDLKVNVPVYDIKFELIKEQI